MEPQKERSCPCGQDGRGGVKRSTEHSCGKELLLQGHGNDRNGKKDNSLSSATRNARIASAVPCSLQLWEGRSSTKEKDILPWEEGAGPTAACSKLISAPLLTQVTSNFTALQRFCASEFRIYQPLGQKSGNHLMSFPGVGSSGSVYLWEMYASGHYKINNT